MACPTEFNIESHVLDHAGQFYDWFDGARTDAAGNLQIIAAEDSAEHLINYTDPCSSRLRQFTPDQVWEIVLDQHKNAQEAIPGSYTANYYAALVAGNWDELDGDMNVIDSLLQRLAFGEVVFG